MPASSRCCGQRSEMDPVFGAKVKGAIDRTTERSEVKIPEGYLPESLQSLQGTLHRWLPQLVGGGDVVIGPIPKGTPVGAIANLKLRSESSDPAEIARHAADLGEFAAKLKFDLLTAPAGATDQDLLAKFANL